MLNASITGKRLPIVPGVVLTVLLGDVNDSMLATVKISLPLLITSLAYTG